jgi:hypothetical protein
MENSPFRTYWFPIRSNNTLQISQVYDLVVLSLLTLGFYANAPISNSVILTDSFICDHHTLTKVLVCMFCGSYRALGSCG